MPGAIKLNDELAYLAGYGLEAYGCALTSTIRTGQRLEIDDTADLGIVLSGALRAQWGEDFATDLAGPTVFLQSDLRDTHAYATQDLRLLSMDHETCRDLLACHAAFRDFFFRAFSARIRSLAETKARLTEAAPDPVH